MQLARIFRASIVIAMLTVLTGSATTSTKELVLIPQADVIARLDADTTVGQYYSLTYQVPATVRAEKLDCVLLEVYVDVRAKVRGAYVNEAPVLEAYALKAPFAESVNLARLDSATRASRSVAVGDGRRVLLDITQIVRAHLSGRLRNDGILLGSFTGTRDGDFTIVPEKFPGSAVARLRVYTKSGADQ